MEGDATKPARHRWLKIRPHWYVCVKCGTLRENEQRPEGGYWRTWWHRPDGRRVLMTATPWCEPGDHTNELLSKAADLENETEDG